MPQDALASPFVKLHGCGLEHQRADHLGVTVRQQERYWSSHRVAEDDGSLHPENLE
jgi:hypothetical protein